MNKLTRSLIATAVLTTSLGLFASPAHAAPAPVKVFQLPCSSAPCSSDADRVANGGAVSKDIEIQTQASSTQWAEIQIRQGSGNWFCIKRWSHPSPVYFKWNTRSIPSSPSGCQGPAPDGPTTWGSATGNDEFGIRVKAQATSSVGSGQIQETDEFRVKLSNAPDRPSLSSAIARGNGTKQAYVELRWPRSGNAEIVQYEIVRYGPEGMSSWLVSASNPAGQDCPSSSSSSYVCRDKSAAFKEQGFEATYEYQIKSYRRTSADTSNAGVSNCRYGATYCVGSQLSEPPRSASVTGPPVPSPEPVPSSPASSGGSTPSSTPTTAAPSPSATKTAEEIRRERELAQVLAENRRQDYLDFFSGEYDETLPFDQRGGLLGGGPIYGGTIQDPNVATDMPFNPVGGRDPTPYRAAAGGSLMLLVAAHMARLLKRSHNRA